MLLVCRVFTNEMRMYNMYICLQYGFQEDADAGGRTHHVRRSWAGFNIIHYQSAHFSELAQHSDYFLVHIIIICVKVG